jgi:hypothetical protein
VKEDRDRPTAAATSLTVAKVPRRMKELDLPPPAVSLLEHRLRVGREHLRCWRERIDIALRWASVVTPNSGSARWASAVASSPVSQATSWAGRCGAGPAGDGGQQVLG